MPITLLFSGFLFLGLLSPQIGVAQLGQCVYGDCQEGYGHFKWQNGEEYVGNFQAGKRHGYGVFYWTDKRKFVGHWKAGTIDGEGMLFYKNGYIKQGVWANNKFLYLKRNPFKLSEKTLSHGKKQLEQLLDDRPAMKTLVEPNDFIWNWTIRRFAGIGTQVPIFWQANSSHHFPIPTGVNAVHAYPTSRTEGRIWVRQQAQAEAMWAGLVYEFFNIQNGSAFQQIEKDAKAWRCNKVTYIERYVALEYKAAQQTKIFYEEVWAPFCKSKGIESQAQLWFYYLPSTVEAWMASFKDPQGYPWHPYEAYYQKAIQSRTKNY